MNKILISEKELVNLIKKIIKEDTYKPTKEDWLYATQIAQEIEQWWKGSEKEKFFSDYQYWIDDDDEGAATMYRTHLNDYRIKLKNKLSNGYNNPYYIKLDSWFKDIIDQIDDTFQNECELYLKSPDEKTQYKYVVDPEID